MTTDNQALDTERRRHRRIDAYNQVDYVLFDRDRKKVNQGKGRTRNLSRSGTLLETGRVLEGAFVVLMTLDLNGETVKVKGRVISSRLDPATAKYLTGIEFLGSEDEQHQAIVTFVRSYHYRKRKAEKTD